MHQLALGCTRRGYENEIFVGEYSDRQLPPTTKYLFPRWMQRLFHSRFHRFTRRWFDPRTQVNHAFVNLARRDFDLVHLHSFHGIYASIGSLAELSRRIPVIWTFHRFWGVTGGCDHPGGCTRYLDSCGECPRVHEWPICGVDNTRQQLAEKKRLLAPAPLTIVAPSRHLARVVRRSPVGATWNVEVIPNGVDANLFRPGDPARKIGREKFGLSLEKSVVVVVNRSFSDPVKGGDILADAITGLDFSRAQVVLVGGDIDQLRPRLPREADIVELGYINDRPRLAELLRVSDLFLYASPRENFPCATLEAMSAGCCIVSTPTDGVLEQIQDGAEGIFSIDFTGANLARAANQVLAQPDSMRRLGVSARERVMREFTEDVMVGRHLQLYARMCARYPRLLQ